MRTTIDIDDAVFRELKRIAADEGSTFRSVVLDALRAELARRKSSANRGRPDKIPTFKGRGVQPGVNLDRNADLLDLMDGHP